MQRREFMKLLSGCGRLADPGAYPASGDAFRNRWFVMGGDNEHEDDLGSDGKQ
jgi:hypothetical protein